MSYERLRMGSRAVWCVALLWCGCAAQDPLRTAAQTKASGERSASMLTIQRQISLAVPKEVAYMPVPLTDGIAGNRGRAATPSPPAGMIRFLGSAAQNSRGPVSLADGKWSIVWSQEMNPQFPVAAILNTRGHILTQAGEWTTFGTDGTKAASGMTGRSALTADLSADLFYLVNQANQVEARTLPGGELYFRWPMAFGEAFAFPQIMRAGRKVMIAGVEKVLFGHPSIPPSQGVLYLFEISGTEIDPSKMLHSVSRSETLIFKEPRMISAMTADRAALAFPGVLAVVDTDLQLKAVYHAGDFEPTLLSVDEAGWMHLIVRQGLQRWLWVVSPEGRRVVNTALSSQMADIAGPPAIGYDRRIYLYTKTSVSAFTPDGKPLWERVVPGGIEGLTITADDRVLVGAGADLSVLDRAGERKVLHRFEGEQISAPPILSVSGDVLVATKQRLYCLRVGN